MAKLSKQHLIFRLLITSYCAIILISLPNMILSPNRTELVRNQLCLGLHYVSLGGILISYGVLSALRCFNLELIMLDHEDLAGGFVVTYTTLCSLTAILVSVNSFENSLFPYAVADSFLLVFMIIDCIYAYRLDDLL